MPKLDDYYQISHLASMPPQMEGRQLGFIRGDKGETAFLNVNQASQTVMVVEVLPGKMRGGHHHVGKEEWTYIISGEVTVYLWLPEAPENVEVKQLNKADLIYMKPGIAHAYTTKSHALMLEQCSVPYAAEHTIIAKALPKELVK